MPLIDCLDCGTRISDRAPHCPHCGCPGLNGHVSRVIVADLDIRFANLVWLMVKAVFAAVPAIIIIALIAAIIAASIGSMLHK